MKFSIFLASLLFSIVSFAQVCTIQGHYKSEVVFIAVMNIGHQLRQTSNIKNYIITSDILEKKNTGTFKVYEGLLSSPPFSPDTAFRLSVNSKNPSQSLYEVIGTYRTVPFVANCQF